MRIDILTIFPGMFAGPFSASIIQRAQHRGLVDIRIHDIRSFTTDKHHVVDDYPFGGGAGMVMKPEPLFSAVETVLETAVATEPPPPLPIILLTPQGRVLNQEVARQLAQEDRLLLICGHYEGVDERVRQHLVTDEISIGDFVLTGGELPAMVLVDTVVRLIPGVLGAVESAVEESHMGGLLEYPHYTRPAEFRGHRVPDILLSGHHAEIAKWRRRQSLERTAKRRPDLLEKAEFSPSEMELVRPWLDNTSRSSD